ncbi:sensor histidine kinase [Xanthomonas campestris]|uniref:histidine kinase n=1 Tax=Xanthomonas campestris pv. papavericola TaxID=487881 RepID=A0AAJ3CCD8_XANCA|nr:HAMP domain-containing sensor histidine kinase [Xanthomonas campestris]MEB2230484.1 HAMP domain-containing sensor histidine kinase [Xanthomonas campestris pv. campestris]MCF8825513.1 HAMP domain-containing histidine kinase [Xanthomonas campestris pv. raphani]MEA9750992.1 HAMP domain-containing sensor histidine kinase [Xanthomonas campestris pv. raphani]MEA9812319.1 HAMP domain-containing sensor histidine kinase [Xanthomonas campestris pv. raphani]MEA9838217.1 HAMP domain-containing sensor h
MASSVSLIDRIQSAPQRELYFFSLYRVLVAGLIAALVFSPLSDAIPEPRYPRLAAGVAIGYLSMAIPLLFWGRSERRLTATVLCAVLADILAATLATHALPGASAGIAMMLLFNVAAGSILLRLRYGMSVAVVASTAIVLEYLWTLLEGGATRPVAELAMFATSYVAVAYICQQIASRARSNQALAEQRGAQVANLYEINELIIRRMRTGVLVVDTHNRITLANEAALALLGDGDQRNAPADLALAALTPELARRLQRWRSGWRQEESPLQLGADRPEVQPRFVRLLADSDLVLIFLDDASVVSRRAESLTLSAMGRFSASLAHEIRNPLAAINYASQLLEESPDIGDADRRLLQIIHQQCQRTNGIVESVLGLARRERANPENLDLAAFVRRFVVEYRQTLSMETDILEASIEGASVHALIDPKHLHQVLTALVHNALKYGRVLDEPARVKLRVERRERMVAIDVIDRGPGIPETVAAQLFRPFYTTSEHGTGLGLYIAQELCRANQAQLDYVSVPGGGACFRILLQGPNGLFGK